MWCHSHLWRTAVAWVLFPSFQPISYWAGLRLGMLSDEQGQGTCLSSESWLFSLLPLTMVQFWLPVHRFFSILFSAMSSWCIISRNLDPVYIDNRQPRNKREEEKFRAEISMFPLHTLSIMVMAGAALGHMPSQEEVVSGIQIPFCQIPLR